MKKARIKYNEELDAFETQYNIGEGWVTERTFMCQTSTKNPMGDANFIHCSILKVLKLYEQYGYKISFKDV